MSKPLHKDPSFWIVAVTLLAAADVAQLKFGIPWFEGKLASMKPAPRLTPTANRSVRFLQQTRNPPHAPGEWRLPHFEPNLFQSASNIVAILPTKFEMPRGGFTPDNPPLGGWATRGQDRAIGVRMPAAYVIQSAYQWNSRARMIFRDAAPPGQFDFIANLPTGGIEALQQEVKKQWGLVGERQTIQTNALALVVSRSDVLKPRTAGAFAQRQPNTINFATLQNMASFLENILNQPILDQTGLSGMFDLPFSFDILNGPRRSRAAGTDERIGRVKKYLNDQFGLDLVETNAPVEMLVVRKASEPDQPTAKGAL